MLCACWKKESDGRRKALACVFVLYCAMMLWLLLFRRLGHTLQVRECNLRLLATVKRFLRVLRRSSDPEQIRFAVANLLGNIGLFVPLGIFLPMLFASMRPLYRFLLCAIPLLIAVELCQYVGTLGVGDVDDVLLNTLGVVIGWLSWKIGTAVDAKIKQ